MQKHKAGSSGENLVRPTVSFVHLFSSRWTGADFFEHAAGWRESDGSTIMIGNNKLQAGYEGGDGKISRSTVMP